MQNPDKSTAHVGTI